MKAGLIVSTVLFVIICGAIAKHYYQKRKKCSSCSSQTPSVQHYKTKLSAPKLYKVLGTEAWERSKSQDQLETTDFDKSFIHLATKEQLPKVLSKFWANEPHYVILTIDPKKIMGELRFETNPGGENKYYHLYGGFIPHDAVLDVQITRHEDKREDAPDKLKD